MPGKVETDVLVGSGSVCLLHRLGETVGRPYMQLDPALDTLPSRFEGDPAFFRNFLRFLAHPKAELRANPS